MPSIEWLTGAREADRGGSKITRVTFRQVYDGLAPLLPEVGE